MEQLGQLRKNGHVTEFHILLLSVSEIIKFKTILTYKIDLIIEGMI
jgi:hypothetical protein